MGLLAPSMGAVRKRGPRFSAVSVTSGRYTNNMNRVRIIYFCLREYICAKERWTETTSNDQAQTPTGGQTKMTETRAK